MKKQRRMDGEMFVTKASGEYLPFSKEKIKASLRRSGADETQINEILKEVVKQFYDGISTKEIYKIAFDLLKSGHCHVAARYHLKKAIMELGPSGFPFEKYVAELLRSQGYQTQTGQILQGKCVTHEIDVIAQKDNEMLLVECKYHNSNGLSSNIKIPLYIHSRFNDVEAHGVNKKSYASKDRKALIVTNTRFTLDAVQYAGCSGLQIWSWDQPFKNGLREEIDRSGLYPITCLTTLTQAEKKTLLDREIVLCTELSFNADLLRSIGVKSNRISLVVAEVQQLCNELKSKRHGE